MRKLFYIIVLLLISYATFGQENESNAGDPNQTVIDSLLRLANTDVPDSTRAILYSEIASKSGNNDSIIKYGNLAIRLALPSDSFLLAKNNYNIGKAYYMLDESHKAIEYFEQSAEILNVIGLKSRAATAYIAIGSCYEDLNNQDSITFYYNKALKNFIIEKDTVKIIYAYLMTGQVYHNLELHAAAIENYTLALQYATLSKDSLEIANCYYLIGQSMFQQTDTLDFKVIEYLRKSISIFESIDTDDTYYIQAKYLAYNALAEAFIKAARTTGQKEYADSCNIYLDKIGDYELSNGHYNNYIKACFLRVDYLLFYQKHTEALAQLEEIGKYMTADYPVNDLKKYHEYLYKVYKLLKNYPKAIEHLEKYDEYKFASLNDSTLSTMKDSEVERTRMIEELKRENAEKLHQAQQKILYIVIVSFAIGIVLIFMMFWHKRKSNHILAEKNNLLDAQKTEIEAQRDEIDRQMHKVATINKDLISSINYAKRIQYAAVSKKSEVDALFPDNFVYYKPCNIVSGDFYRVAQCGRFRVTITADCTGHGIPGAFLSMLGISALKEFCVSEDDAANPGTILDRMRNFIKSTLVSGTEKHIDDGMDMTICCYDFDAMEMRYATANQTAYIIRKGEVIKLKGDHMPVGRYLVEKEHFQSMTTTIEKGDMVYTLSDGIQDQPGGDETEGELGRRFMSKNLVALLKENADKPLDQQCRLLDECITAWRGSRPQVDDMTMIGIRV
ncbi:MAG: SpoIIE family protein phosphatase [Bacteroidales bacterium]|nr:SpoIIE family protein phosphatase [Bacteroidales bacterium]